MKYLKKKKKSPLIPIVCVLGLVLLAAVLVLALLPGRGDQPEVPGQTEPAGTQPVQTTLPPEGDTTPTAPQSVQYVPVETPYCILNFPRQWENYLDVTVTQELPCRAVFSCKFGENQLFRLFEIGFDTGEGEIQGVVSPSGLGAVKVFYLPEESVKQSDMSAEQWETYTAMQACSADVLGRIPYVNDISAGNLEDVKIETPYTELTFPGKWTDYLYVQTDESQGYTVHFYAQFPDGENVRIFSLTFSDEDIGGMMLAREDGSRYWIQVDRPDLRESQLRQDRMTTALLMQEELRTVMESVNRK